MPLSVTCPRCESKYQLDAAMRGKKMRCPNTICRAIFDVRDDSDPPLIAEAPKPTPPPTAPLQAPPQRKPIPKPIDPQPATDFPDDFPGDDEPVANPEPALAAKAAPVVSPPPPSTMEKKTAPAPRPVKQKPVESPPAADFPDDFPGDDEVAPAPSGPAVATEAWQPETAPAVPPVRDDSVPAAPVLLATPAPVRKRRALWIITAMLLVLGAVAAGGYWRIRGGIASNEAERFQKAEEYYKEREFEKASTALQNLVRDFPDSTDSKKYRFLAELSDVRAAAHLRESPQESSKALGRVLYMTASYAEDPLLKEREIDLWQTLEFLAKELTRGAEAEKSPELMQSARSAWAAARKLPPPAGASQAESERALTDEWTRIDKLLAAHAERQRVVATLQKHLEQANAAAVQESQALVERTKRQEDSEIRGLLEKLVAAHREQIRFLPAGAERAPTIAEDALPSLSVTPSVQGAGAAPSSNELVLALARGVLYALEPTKGETRWVRRVGIDTHVLPLRVPADSITPELLLTLSSDQKTLSALIARTGEVFWQTPLSDVCLGQPVLIDRQVLVPTQAGRIDEIEIAEGRLLGSYEVGQSLTLGGVRQPGTPLVYFPADEFCLYVVDASKRTCTNILYTRHPAGSLRGLPVIVPEADPPSPSGRGAAGEGTLLWTQAGQGRGEIKPYVLPITQPEQKPADPILKLAGLSAPPRPQADRLAVATETGYLSLWGYHQKGTRDPLLFPLLKQDFPVETGKSPGRCQIVHADAENYWTLMRGRLQRVEMIFDPSVGPRLRTRWTQPINLGTLLHAAQARHGADGRTILYLTTQADDHPTCLCSAIDASDGKVLWQRQLGVVPQQPPREIAGQIVLRDATGLLRFDPAGVSDKLWQPAGAWLDQQPDTDAAGFLLTRQADYTQLSALRGSKKLHVRVGNVGGSDKPRALELALPDALQGTPAIGAGFLLLPLANGIIVRANLQDGALINGPDWRAVGAEDQARGHLVMLDATEFIRTDGSRGLARIASTDGKTWGLRAEAKKLAHRIVKAPLVLPATTTTKARLCVADASDTLTLLDTDRLTVLQSFGVPGTITAGPVVRAGKIGCVVGRNRLVWLDPDKNWLDPDQRTFAWQYGFDADIVGVPHVIDDVLVVADVAGHFAALDPADGARLGMGLTLKANAAATAAPLPFGSGRAFVPLTDGTILLLPLEKLRSN